MSKKDCLIWIDKKEARVTHFGTTILELNLETKEIYYFGGYSQTDSRYMNDLLQKWKFFKVGENEGFFTVHRRSKESNDYEPCVELWKRTKGRKDERIIIKESKRMIIISQIYHISFLEYMKN